MKLIFHLDLWIKEYFAVLLFLYKIRGSIVSAQHGNTVSNIGFILLNFQTESILHSFAIMRMNCVISPWMYEFNKIHVAAFRKQCHRCPVKTFCAENLHYFSDEYVSNYLPGFLQCVFGWNKAWHDDIILECNIIKSFIEKYPARFVVRSRTTSTLSRRLLMLSHRVTSQSRRFRYT